MQDLVQSAEEDMRHVLGQIRADAVVELSRYGSDKVRSMKSEV